VGAANAMRVYTAWSHLDDRPLRLLIYMALRARDHDAEPWYGAGHEELATIALGLKPPQTDREREAVYRTVRRAMTALHQARAIRTTRYSAPGKQASYRLYLDGPTQDGHRPVNTAGDNPETQDGERPVNELFTGRSASERRTVSVRTQDGERPTEEEEEEEEQRTSKANLRNGELWKAPTRDAAEPSGNHVNGNLPTTPDGWLAWRAEARRRIDATQDPT
jgi:hypothetical protein